MLISYSDLLLNLKIRYIFITSIILICLFSIFTLCGFAKDYAKYTINDQLLTPQEIWILKQIEKGEPANLTSKYSMKRRIRAIFLEKLITDGFINYHIHNRDIVIKGAVIFETFNLANCEVNHSVSLIDCNFLGEVKFNMSNFKKMLILDYSKFSNDVDFSGIKIHVNFLFRYAVFFKKVDLTDAIIGNTIAANSTIFKDNNGIAQFRDIKVGNLAIFDNAIFRGAVDFSSAEIGRSISIALAKFLNKEQKVSFEEMKVGRFFRLSGSIFEGPVDLGIMNIGESILMGIEGGEKTTFKGKTTFYRTECNNFLAPDCLFDNSENVVIFDMIKVLKIFSLQRSVFKAGANFDRMDIGKEFHAEKVQFLNKEQMVSFNNANVDGLFDFQNAVFEGPSSFLWLKVRSEFMAFGLTFLKQNNKIDFNYIKVGGSIIMREIKLNGTLDISNAEVSGNIYLGSREADERKYDIKLDYVKCNTLYCVYEKYSGDISIEESNITWLRIIGNKENYPINNKNINLNGTIIRLGIFIGNANINDLTAIGIKVGGMAIFADINFINKLNIQYSYIKSIYFREVKWPEENDNILIQDMNYNTIEYKRKGENGDDPEELITLISKSRFSRQNYIKLEEYF
jgi:hypothetical protein